MAWDYGNKEREQKIFNKGIMDLKHLAMLEMYATESRINKDYNTWVNVLEAWSNRLSPDLSLEELKKLDQELSNTRRFINDKNAQEAVRSKLNDIERRLYKIEHEIGVSNPKKDQDSWLTPSEDWTFDEKADEVDDYIDKVEDDNGEEGKDEKMD